jgi:Tol biopolymer transport system component
LLKRAVGLAMAEAEGRTGPESRESTMRRRRTRLAVVLILSLSGVACSDRLAAPIHEPKLPDAGPLPELSVSDARGRSVAGEGTSAASVQLAYVALPPGSLPTVETARIRNLAGSAPGVTVPVIEGGFDPVPIPAAAGDQLELTLTHSTGAVSIAYARVPPRRPPVVVRTFPTMGRTDVALSIVATVIFSEPIDASTLATGVRLFRGDEEVTVAVELAANPWEARVVPAAQLEPRTDYELRITSAVRDLEGDSLETSLNFAFRTEAVVFPAPGYNIYLADPSGLDLWHLAPGYGPTWSPDGREIAFTGSRGDGTSSGIFVMDVGGTARRRLRGGDSWLLRWSPEGSKIAFVTCIPNGENMCDMKFGVINSDGSGEILLAQINTSGTIPPAEWSPDGKKIAFVGGERCCADLYVINADGSGLTQLTRLGTVTGVDWSPDGRTLALRAAESVYVVNADGTNRIAVATNAVDPRWLRDGRTLSFGRWFVDEIWTVSADGGEPSLLLRDGFGAEWSADGTRIAYVRHHR